MSVDEHSWAWDVFRHLLTQTQDESQLITADLLQCGEDAVLRLQNAANATLEANDTESEDAAREQLDAMIEQAYKQMSLAYQKVAPICWRRMYTDASIFRSMADLMVSEPRRTESLLKAAVARLDRAIIIAGACGEKRLELIQDLVAGIQATIPRDVTSGKELPPYVTGRHIELPATFSALVQRLDSPPSFASFISTLHSRPFVLPGYIREWPALTNHPWRSMKYLRTVAGPGRVVPIEVGSDYRSDDWTQKMMDVDGFLDALLAFAHGNADGSPILYLAQHSIFMQFPALRDDIIVPDYLYSSLPAPDNYPQYQPPSTEEQLVMNAWLGPSGTISPAHTDPFYNFYAQVVGRKTVWLAPPECTPYMYPYPSPNSAHGTKGASQPKNPAQNNTSPSMSNTSQVDVFSDVSEEQFPLFVKHVVPEAICVTLEAGDLLFFPPAWWHALRRVKRVTACCNRNAYDYLFSSNIPLSKIKDAALGGRLFTATDPCEAGVAGRSFAWKLFLIEVEPLQTTAANVVARCPIRSLKESRKDYQQQLLQKMRAPDGGYEEGFVVPGTTTVPPRAERPSVNLDRNNPLSLHDENPWNAWFASMELRKTILQDVERTFPDIGYFREPEVQTQLTNILFLYSVSHPDIGYRQGMHELLAPLYYAIDYDSVPEDAELDDVNVKEFASRAWVAADAWALFSRIMLGVGRWYEWQEPKGSPKGTTPLPSHVHLSATPDVVLKPYVAPIIEACNRIQSTLLKSVDPQLWRSLQSSGIEPQIYGIRWLRLLFTRELSMDDAMLLWDGLFACDPSFDLAPWVCVAMLMRIRNKLIPADYSTQLTFLLRYPGLTSSDGSPNLDTPIHPAVLLLRQALTLQMSPSSVTGISVVNENHNLLNIPTEVPDPPPPPARRRARTAMRGESVSTDSGTGAQGVRLGHARQGSAPMGLPEMIARGLLERGESLGINKTVMNAVSELKRNLPDLAASLARLPATPSASSSYAAYPLADERSTAERPPWEPRTRFEMEREVTETRSSQRRLGDSVGWIVDTLLLDEDDGDKDRVAVVRERKREALECLSYVRDVLKGTVPQGEVDESRLFSEEEMKKRRKVADDKATAEAAKKLGDSTPSPPLIAGPTPPKPTAAALPQFQAHPQASMRRLPDNSFTPTFPRYTSQISTPPQPIARQKAPSPTPTVSVLTPNTNAVPLAPWNYTPSAFSSRSSPIATLPRMPSRPSAATSVRHSSSRLSSTYVPSSSPPEEATPRSQPTPQDPLGVLRY
ncbi:hypothetical protein NM688_g5023 [Phlebia brevispora]|uniref:Uncharacterized protein n=1 Tax=Phlebia brevispora TaxID=194682 RepID=A0ACC1T1B3_9APHY|nr:hypothetical protein NM688_g5023 [Phlebia brevispora]